MKQLDASEQGLCQFAWSPDGRWLAYVRNEDEVCIADVAQGDIRIIGKGASPGFGANNDVVYASDDEIRVAQGTGHRTLVRRDDLNRQSPKTLPVVSPDGRHVVFVVNHVFHKESQNLNAYSYRHFLGRAAVDGSDKPVMLNSQWYGGVAFWFPQSDRFGHFEYDSTGGARIHIHALGGKRINMVSGLHPAVSPDGRRIACKPRTAQNVVVYTAKEGLFTDDDLETAVFRIPESDARLTGNSPQWLDNRYVLVDEGGRLFRIDTRKEDPTEMKKLPVPVNRGVSTMCLSPDRSLLAVEVAHNDAFALHVVPLS